MPKAEMKKKATTNMTGTIIEAISTKFLPKSC